MWCLPLSLALVLACGDKDPVGGDDGGAEDTVDTGQPVDADGDGVPAAEDCDDTDPDAFPGNDEVCDDRDNDCDGDVDEDAVDAAAWFRDADGDGHGDPDDRRDACLQPDGYVISRQDCDDGDPAVHPGAAEVPCDGVDNDCDAASAPLGGARIGDVEYDSLEEGLAAMVDGDVVEVCEGEHRGYHLVGASGRVEAVGPLGSAVLVTDEDHGALIVVADEVTVVGLEVWAEVAGRVCVDISSPGAVALRDSWLHDCPMGALTHDGDGTGTLSLVDVEVSDCEGGPDTAAVVIEKDGVVTMEGVLVHRNMGGDGGAGGVSVANGGYVTADEATEIRDNGGEGGFGGGVELHDATWVGGRIVDNESWGWAGGLYVRGDAVVIGAHIEGNEAGTGGGIYVAGNASLRIEDSAVVGNGSNEGAYLSEGAVLNSSLVDWGVGGDDNDGTDVRWETGATYRFDDLASFHCEDGACG